MFCLSIRDEPRSILIDDPAGIFPAADIISTVEFDHTGDYLATGDKGGRVVLFERNESVRPDDRSTYIQSGSLKGVRRRFRSMIPSPIRKKDASTSSTRRYVQSL